MRFVGVTRPWISNLLLDETLPNVQNPLHPHEPKPVGKKIPTPKGWYVRYWWSRGELNPRPRALCRQFYMRSRLIFNLTSDFAKRQAGPWRFTWF